MRYLNLWNENTGTNPWRGLFELQRNLDRVFDQVTNENRNENWDSQTFFQPAVEVEESDAHYVVNVDLPGVSKKDINIEVKDNYLFVTGERKSERKDKSFSERSYGKFQRYIKLPEGIDADKIEAQYQDGVLSVALPKAEAVKPKQIKITEGKSSFFGKLLSTHKEEKEVKNPSSNAA